MKQLIEKRNELIEEMQGLVENAQTEIRALTEEEDRKFNEMKKEISAIDTTIHAADEARQLEKRAVTNDNVTDVSNKEHTDEQRFLDFCRGEERALSIAENGGIVPQTIADRIIQKVKDLCPIYQLATVYNVSGDLIFPVYEEAYTDSGETPHKLSAAYVEDLTELTEDSGRFTTIRLQNFIVGCLTKISKSLMNRTDFDLLSYIVNEVAKKIVEFLEKEFIVGTASKMTGVLSATNGVTTAASTAITADELIDLQMTIPQLYQQNACWIMNRSTLAALRKLKDANENYLLNRDISTEFGWNLLGRPVYTSDSMPAIAAGTKAVVYGDMSGLVVKMTKNIEIQVLNEKYATQHAVGVVAYVECDSKIVENDKLAVLTMKAGE